MRLLDFQLLELMKAVGAALGRCAMIVALPILAVVGLAESSAGVEILYSVAHDANFFALVPVTLLLAFQVLTTACFAVDPRQPEGLSREEYFARTAVPQLVFVVVFGLPVWLGALSAAPAALGRLSLLVWVLASVAWVGIAVSEYRWTRHDLGRALSPAFLPLAAPSFALLLTFVGLLVSWVPPSLAPALTIVIVLAVASKLALEVSSPSELRTRYSPEGGVKFWAAVAAVLVCVAVWDLSKNPAESVATALGPLVVVQVFIGISLAVATILVFWWRFTGTLRPAGSWPWRALALRLVPAMILVVLLFFLLTGPYNEAPVRALDAPPASERPALAEHLALWLEERRPEIEEATEPYPVLLVAAEGGGIRATYWTATVLADLDDRLPGFRRHLLAISGVSGGSVGGAIYTALAHDGPSASLACAADGRLLPCARRVAGADLLSAPLAATLLTDVFRSTFRSSRWPDRATVLEETLEEVWADATGTSTLGAGLGSIWSDPACSLELPLFLSSLTSTRDGRRVVLAPFPHPDEGLSSLWPERLPARLRLSTAAVASARFPGISPTALLPVGDGVLRAVDGGYADNSGAATTRELLGVLLTAAAELGIEDRIEPVVLVLGSGPPRSAGEPIGIRGQLPGVVLDPVLTLEAVRSGLGQAQVELLAADLEEAGGRVIGPVRPDENVALTWLLSSPTRARLDEQRAAHLEPLVGRLGRELAPFDPRSSRPCRAAAPDAS